jgi:hypothetical protein
VAKYRRTNLVEKPVAEPRFFVLFLPLLRMEPRASCLIHKHSTTEPSPTPQLYFIAKQSIPVVYLKDNVSSRVYPQEQNMSKDSVKTTQIF